MRDPSDKNRVRKCITRSTRHAIALASCGAMIVLWSAASLSGYLRPDTIPAPWAIIVTCYRLSTSGFAGSTLQAHILVSLGRFLAGYVLAVSIGIPLGLIMGWSSPIRSIVTPYFEAMRFIAPLAWVPFAALWFGTGIGGPTLIVFSGAFAACVINTFRGAKFVDPILLDATRMLCANPWRLLTDVLLPGSLSSIFAGLRVSAALAWQSLIGAELIAAQSGVGYLIVQGQGSLQTSIVFAGMATIGLVGFAIDRVLQFMCDHFDVNRRLIA